MGDFYVPPPNSEAPPDIGSITPDFKQIGQEISEGFQDSTLAGGILKAVLAAGKELIAFLAAWLIRIVFYLLAQFTDLLTRVDEKADPAYGTLIAATIEHLFGVVVNPEDMTGRNERGKRVVVAQNVGQAILGALFAGAPTSGAGGLPPSSAAAEEYLNRVVHMGIEGWIEAWLADALSYHELEKFGELKDIVARDLGLGRLSRRILAPPVNILVTQPWTEKLNLAYRPTKLPHELACRQYMRGAITRDQLDDILGRQGWDAQNIEMLINSNSKFLSSDDLEYAMQRGVWTEDQAQKYLQDQGYDLPTAQTIVAMLVDKRVDPYRKQLVEISVAAYERGDMDADTLHAAVAASGLPDQVQSWILKIAGARRETNLKHLSRGDVEAMIKAGIMNVGDLRAWMQRENYPLQEIQFLELLLLADIKDKSDAAAKKQAAADAAAKAKADKAAADAQKKAAAAAAAANKGVSLAQADQLVKTGVWTFDQYQAWLASHGFAAASQADLAALLHAEVDAKAAAAAKASQLHGQAKEKQIPLATQEAAVKAGIISMEQFQKFLAGQNYAPDDQAVLVELLQEQIGQAKAAAAAKAGAQAKAAQKGISLAELERAVRLGITPIDTYRQALVAAGEDPASVDTLVALLSDQMLGDRSLFLRQSAGAAATAKKGISLAQLSQAVRDGLRPLSDYTAALSALGYPQEDIDTLAGLLQAAIDHQKTVVDKQTAAAAKVATKGISLAEVNTAVKLGVIPMSEYTAMLAKFGFSADDRQILTLSMAAELQKAKAAASKATAVSKTVAKKGLNQGQMEAAVVGGLQPMSWYAGELAAAGIGQADIDVLTGLAQLKADNARAAAEKHATAEAKAADKELPLAKEEAAVTAGLQSMDDYAAYLKDLAFEDTDVSILQGLLASKIDAAQQKAAAAGAAPPAGAAPKTSKKKKAAAPATPVQPAG